MRTAKPSPASPSTTNSDKQEAGTRAAARRGFLTGKALRNLVLALLACHPRRGSASVLAFAGCLIYAAPSPAWGYRPHHPQFLATPITTTSNRVVSDSASRLRGPSSSYQGLDILSAYDKARSSCSRCNTWGRAALGKRSGGSRGSTGASSSDRGYSERESPRWVCGAIPIGAKLLHQHYA
jgi:hypothetical protein